MKFKISRLIFVIFMIAVIFAAFNIKAIGRYYFPIKYSNYIYEYSKQYELDPYFIAAIIKTESNYNPKAKSSKDAYGLMQVTSSTGTFIAEALKIKNFNKEKLYDPEYNINIGCWYLSSLKKEFKNTNVVVAAYNGGRGNVRQWLNNPQYSADGETLKYIPFSETDRYVKKVNTYYNIYRWLYLK